MAITKYSDDSTATSVPPCRPTRPKPPLAPKRPATTRFHVSVYHVGTTATQEHHTLTLEEIEHLYNNSSPDSPIPLYALVWAIAPHVAGDSLLAIATDPGADPPSVVRYQIIVE